MKYKKTISLLLICLMLCTLSTPAIAIDFTDVPNDHPFKVEIDYCQNKGYLTGTSATTFSPNGSLTRGQLAVILCRAGLFQSNWFNTTLCNFADIVPLQHYYDAAAIIMASRGIMLGTSETIFSPNNVMTREQLAVIMVRTLHLGAVNELGYMRYADHASISEWARTPVSACINAHIIDGLFDGSNFEPQKAVTRAELCKMVHNIDRPSHIIVIAPMSGGTIEAYPSRAQAGWLITLSITPDGGKRLKAGTLKYNGNVMNGSTFTMPDADVLITAEFEDAPKPIAYISIKSIPDKHIYNVGDTLDLTGLVITVQYVFTSSVDMTSGFTTDPAAGTVLNTPGTVPVTVTYTEGDSSNATSFDIQVKGS